MYVMYTTAAVAAVGGNGIVCYLVLAYKRMRTVSVRSFHIATLYGRSVTLA